MQVVVVYPLKDGVAAKSSVQLRAWDVAGIQDREVFLSDSIAMLWIEHMKLELQQDRVDSALNGNLILDTQFYPSLCQVMSAPKKC
jgi:hypothetical protein